MTGGKGSPEGDDNDQLLQEGNKIVLAEYTAQDWGEEPFYVMFTPKDYLKQFRSWILPDPQGHPPYTEILTYNDY